MKLQKAVQIQREESDIGIMIGAAIMALWVALLV